MSVIEMQPTYGERRAPRRSQALTKVAAVLVTVLPLLGLARANSEFLLVNSTPSEPQGLYVRAAGAPVRVGDIAAFPAPPAAFPYADRRMGYLHRTPILKTVSAAAGDEVCTQRGVLTINGIRRGAIADRDRDRVPLPHWGGCRRLRPGEVFAFSDRVPNSFDSRYFGPISVTSAVVYRPLATSRGLGR